MKKLLPVLFVFFLFALLPSFFTSRIYAAAPNQPNLPAQPAQPNQPNQPNQPAAPVQLNPAAPTGGLWVVDPEVTFIGKNAARSGQMLDWTLKNYNWVCVSQNVNGTCDNSKNPLATFWGLIVLYIVVPMLFVVILATAIVIIVTRGRSLTIMRFIPRFVAVILLIVFSYAIVQFLYQFTDLIQGFFLQSQQTGGACPPNCISQQDLLFVGWKYEDFIGMRLLGDYNAESAFISLLLTKLTALTYFVMVGILLMRRIILWFFIIISPIFPLLLLYYPVRNTGKIWIGEFFRWLLYAPLFAIFLKGLVFLWRTQIPLNFINPNIGNANGIVYPTAVNILLGGPKQFVTPANSVNLVETFSLYVVALIMLWCVILLPWILLQIFLDYAAGFAPSDTAVMRTLVNMTGGKGAPVPPGGGGSSPQNGTAINLPFTKKYTIPVGVGPTGAARELRINADRVETKFAQPAFIPSAQVNAQVLTAANLPLPTMRDIAKYETALMSNNVSQRQEVSKVRETLERIANPVAVESSTDRERFSEIREKLTQDSQQGNILATSILNAANQSAQNSTTQIKNVLQQIANPSTVSSVTERERMTNIHSMLQQESRENNNQLASTLLSVTDKTSSSEIEKIREQLMQANQQTSNVSASVLSQVSSSQQSAQSTRELKSVLQQIANPTSVASPVEHERFSKLHDALQKESRENNSQIAKSILSVNDTTSEKELQQIKEQLVREGSSPVASQVNNAVQSTQIKRVLQQIANPASVNNTVERERYSKMHDMLAKESKENNNQLATSILSVNDKTSLSELEKIHDQLLQSKENTVTSTVVSAINSAAQQTQAVTRVKTVLQQVANPASVTNSVDREKISKLHQSLVSASKQGNELASSILSINEKTSSAEVSKLQEKLMQSRTQPLAGQVAEMTQKALSTALPVVNRVQTVTQQDYQAVKEMWKENYNKLEVPQGMAGSREEWIKDDITKIESITKLLSSSNQEEVNQGLEQVSNILPFLLVGGFSQSEIVEYLKAKQEAAREVSVELTKDEEEKVSIGVRHEAAVQTMAASIEEPTTSVSENVVPEITFAPAFQPQISNEILNMVDVKVPKMRDIARFETMSLSQDKSRFNEIQKTHEVLERLANPALVGNPTDRDHYEKLREKLLEEREKGNSTASILLSAASTLTGNQEIKTFMQKIANPELASVSDKERFAKLHTQLDKASQQGNALATDILSVKKETAIEEVEKLSNKLREANKKGEVLAGDVLSGMSTQTIPNTNQTQKVQPEDYDEVRKMWEENYRTLPIPTGYSNDIKGRKEWIQADAKEMNQAIALLTSPDAEKRSEGMKAIAGILPFLLLGGFSLDEMVRYLKVKIEAGETVRKELEEEESKLVSVPTTARTEEQKEMTAQTESESEKKEEVEKR